MTEVALPEAFFDPSKRDKKLILAISDIPLAATGVAVQFNQMITYLLGTGEYMLYVIGGAVQHPDMNIKIVTSDFIIEPCIGQGNREIVRARLADLQPDAVFIFTDPHQYIYLWEMSDEVKQICPILYWHVWDNDPYPDCNTMWYNDTDFIGAISKLTYDLVSSKFPEKTKYIPHTFSPHLYFPLPKESKQRAAEFFFQQRADWFKLLWVNRNGGRKQLIELLQTFKDFLDELELAEGHRKSVLLIRTEPDDIEGPNVKANIDLLGLEDNIIIVPEKLEYPLMNVLYNSADLNLNISKAEGFGLTLLTAMNTKTLCAGVMTGGMKEQLVDQETGEEFGLPIKVHHRNLVGSQMVPYIYEDYASREDILAAIRKAFCLSPEEREDIVERAYKRATGFFGYKKIMGQWKEAFDTEIAKFKANKLNKNQWTLEEIIIPSKKEAMIAVHQVKQIEEHQRMLAAQAKQNTNSELAQNVLSNLMKQQKDSSVGL